MKISDDKLQNILTILSLANYSGSLDRELDDAHSAFVELERLREEQKLIDIKSAPRDRTSILLKVKDAPFLPGRCERLAGIWLVGRSDSMGDWGFAAPVGYGGIPDEWIAGWLPLPMDLPEEE